MSTLAERRDVFWKRKAKRFAIERDQQAHLRCETENKLSDVTGDRKTILKRFRLSLRWARTWKKRAKQCYSRCSAQYKADGEYQQELQSRILDLEEILQTLTSALTILGAQDSVGVRKAIELLRDRSWWTKSK